MITNSKEFLNEQYRDSSKLDIRIKLHEIYSTNKTDWHEWVFHHIKFKKNCSIIEFGCGSGSLWGKNKSKIADEWKITLSDLSEGMLNQAKQSLKGLHNVTYKIMDIQDNDSETSVFDIAIANHMLYHVPDTNKALAETVRVLKPQGIFYAATNGQSHIHEIYDFAKEFDSSLSFSKPLNSRNFSLENGEQYLRNYFREVQLIRYHSNLEVTSAQDLADYMFSIGTEFKEALNDKKDLAQFIQFLEHKKNEHGVIHISKDSGLFVCFK